MIKKLFLCAALVGAVGLTSCVDDVESASVTAVRNAKAEQLKALADVEKANAEAAIIKANALMKEQEIAAAKQQADAEYTKAQAEKLKADAAYVQAQAAMEQAKADFQNAQTEQLKAQAEINLEKAKAELEQKKANADQAKAYADQAKTAAEKAKAELARYLAETQIAIAKAQYEAEKVRADMLEVMSKVIQTGNTNFSNAVSNYNNAASKLSTLNTSLIEKQFYLARLNAGLVNWDEALKNKLVDYNKKLTEMQTKQQELAAQIAIYQTDDYQNATTQIASLKKEETRLTALNRDESLKYMDESSALQAASKAVEDSPYMTAVTEFTTATSYDAGAMIVIVDEDGNMTWPSSITPTPAPSVPVNVYGNYCVVVSETDNAGNTVYDFTPLLSLGEQGTEMKITVKVDANGNIKAEAPTKVTSSGSGSTTRSGSSTTTDTPKAIEYTYYTYTDPYYKYDAAGAKVLSDQFAAWVAELKEEAEDAKTLLDDMTTQQTAVTTAVKAYKDIKAPAADATQEVQDKYAADIIKPVQDLYKVLKAANDAIAKAVTDGDIVNSSIVSVTLPTEAPEATEGTDWDNFVANVTGSNMTQVQKNVDNAVYTANSDNNSAQKDLLDAQKEQKEVNDNLATLAKDGETFQGLVDKAKAAKETAETTHATIAGIDSEMNIVKAKILAYGNLIADPDQPSTIYYDKVKENTEAGSDDFALVQAQFSKSLNTVANVKELINEIQNTEKEVKKQIVWLNQQIADTQAAIDAGYTVEEGKHDLNELIKKTEAEIDQLKAQIAYQEEIVKGAKAALEAAIEALEATQTPETPSTPAE